MALSFGFCKTVKRKLITAPSAALADKKRKEDEEDGKIEFIQSIGTNGATTTPKDKDTTELVIPLIKTNRWYFPKEDGVKKERRPHEKDGGYAVAVTNGTITTDKDKDLDLEQQAIREILNEARDGVDKESVLNIPLLVQNRIPEGYETDDNLDVTLRPVEPTLDDYDRVPIEEFGLAMLRGMGWKKDEGIGLRNKAVVQMKEPELRPRGLGLGATKPNTDSNNTDSKNNSSSKKSSRPPSPPPMGLRVKNHNHKK